MSPAEIAEFVQARPVGAGRWIARCPGHDDRSPSLSIGTGGDGQTLLHCHRGCTLKQVLTASGLRLQDLFPCGPRPSREQLRAFEVERIRRKNLYVQQRNSERAACNRVRTLAYIVNALGEKLARMHDPTPGDDALIRLFHRSIDLLHAAETALELAR